MAVDQNAWSDLVRQYQRAAAGNIKGAFRMPVSAEETEEYVSFAKDLARHGGMMIREAFHQKPKPYDRKSETDPVTETDRAVEEYVFGRIRAQYPTHECVGEETAFSTDISEKPTWIVDPIDGTANCKLVISVRVLELNRIFSIAVGCHICDSSHANCLTCAPENG